MVDQWLLSRNQFNEVKAFGEGVKLDVYANTMMRTQQGAFAQALELYHQIRGDKKLKLLDSQFRSHQSYKVFNIKYIQPGGNLTLTEFYIDEQHNDLFVITAQAKQANWDQNWQMAESIISNL